MPPPAATAAPARRAGSSSNLNVWSVVAVRDAARRARLAELAGNQDQVREAPLQLVWLADLARLRRVATACGRPADGLDYLEMFLTGVIDAALAAQNGAAAAESLGLGMVYIGGVRNHPAAINLRAMKKGDLAFFYHSNIGVEVVGILKISKEA